MSQKLISVLRSNLPDQLLSERVFLLADGKKPHYAGGHPRSGALDGSEDVARLATFDDAAAAVGNRFDGMGIAVVGGGGFVVADLDHCLDPKGQLLPDHAAMDLAKEAVLSGAYVERSVSGRGLHIVGPCSLDFAGTDLAEGVSIYRSKRFIRLTGEVWGGAKPKGWTDLGDLAALKAFATASRTHGDAFEPIDPEDVGPDTIADLREALSAIPADNYDTWTAVGNYLASLGDRGRSLWAEWSATSSKFRGERDLARWDSFRGDNTDFRAVFVRAKAHGWNAKRKPRDAAEAFGNEPDEGQGVARPSIRGEVVDPAQVSEDAIAQAFTDKYGGRLRFDHTAGKWFGWDGVRWRKDSTALAFHFARQLGRELTDGQRSMNKASVAGGAERFARADPVHATTADQWDKDPMLLGTPKGVVDLTTGQLRPAIADDMITKLTAVGPEEGEPTRWLTFLDEALAGDTATIAFLQQWFGYCLTGSTQEHALAFLYGPGGNGKSVCINTMAAIFGDYAQTSTMDTFTASKFDKHTTDLAMLKGARLVTASETEEGRAWAEARIKSLTGGDPITARFMRQDNFTFRPEFKLMIAGNHAPSLRNVDEAMRRRLLIVPFTNTPKVRNPSLEDDLRSEHGKILSWAIEGCLFWQDLGLIRPKSIEAATDEYFADQDLFGQWLDDRCLRGERRSEKPTILFMSWSSYAKARGDQAGTMKGFAAELKKRGFTQKKSGASRFYVGLSLNDLDSDDDA